MTEVMGIQWVLKNFCDRHFLDFIYSTGILVNSIPSNRVFSSMNYTNISIPQSVSVQQDALDGAGAGAIPMANYIWKLLDTHYKKKNSLAITQLIDRRE